MMEVFKFDGSLQCGMGAGESVDDMASKLITLGVTPVSGEKRQYPGLLPQACGLKTGMCNAYVISDADWASHGDAILSAGFDIWESEPSLHGGGRRRRFSVQSEGEMGGGVVIWPFTSERPVPIPFSIGAPRLDPTKTISELVGKRVRIYRDGDMITQDFRLDRVNIVLHPATATVIDVWFG